MDITHLDRRKLKSSFVALAIVVGAASSASLVSAQETAAYFKAKCGTCHTIGGGRLVGPDLKYVAERKDAQWLTRFILNPKSLIDSGDSYAQQMLQDYRNVMPDASVTGLTVEKAEAVLQLIEAESKLERSQFAGGAEIPDRPFTPEEVNTGWELFVGTRALAKGGPSCLSCHSVLGATAIGGGRLGPDLSGVYNKLQGRKGLAAWLMSPPTPTMQPIYQNAAFESQEILALIAYLESINQTQTATAPLSADRLTFFMLGLAVTAGAFVGFDWIWRRRFRGVRRPLVERNSHTARSSHHAVPEGKTHE